MDRETMCGQTIRFTENVRDSLRDMLGVETAQGGDAVVERTFDPRRKVVAMIHFTGSIQGDCVLNLEEDVAARLAGAWREGMLPDELRNCRADFGGMLKELLNTAAGKALPSLEEGFGRLTFHPPMVVYGEIDAPSVPAGTSTLRTSAGEVDCTLVLDMAGDDNERVLRQAIADLEKARKEVATCYKVLSEIVRQSRSSRSPTNVVSDELIGEAMAVLGDVRESVGEGTFPPL